MKTNRICPECGSLVGENERFCGECGTEIKPESPENDIRDGAIIGAGARANISGGITNTNNTQNSISTSSVDNSTNSTINNTTIVMGRDKNEFCEVCGRPLGEEYAKCPKCGKHICMHCMVPGKNRCIECEKKALNEYRLTFQQLFTTTVGNIGTAGRQLMDQKARELNIEKEKEDIEEEIRKSAPPQPLQAGKGVLVSDRGYYENMPSKDRNTSGNGKTKILIGIVAAIICIAAVVYFVAIKDKTESEIPVQTEALVPEIPDPNTGTASPAAATEKQKEVHKEPAPAEKTPVKPASVDVDQKYMDGMKAYENKDALKAISLFKASGSADANYMLGIIYESGCGSVSPNAMMARKYFKAAAEMGHDKAKTKLK